MAMNTVKLLQPVTKKLRLIQYIAKNGVRVFRRAELEAKIANDLQVSYETFGVLLYKLAQEGWITQVRRGIYVVANPVTPIYEQEIAMALVDPAVISHWSAFCHHGLTDQVFNHLQITTTGSIPRGEQAGKRNIISINGVNYEFIQINNNKFFGVETAWVGEGRFQVTDLERTFLDGLSRPHYCGGFQEIINIYREYFAKVNLDKIINYALRLDVAVSRRLGWILDNFLCLNAKKIYCLARKDSAGYRLLDSSSADIGLYDHKWRLRLNYHVN